MPLNFVYNVLKFVDILDEKDIDLIEVESFSFENLNNPKLL
ncbi:hypothetical protein [Mycoplasma crocodyli]|uniref:Uncharacterized protein n=1 Tax=Mycoplasma crocodyli (strain ATCC 51981 / MP145) TaxID=512564 RepID=D5E680_MYCCM|nr:hypothetical protein [Mycoplasma crocodyli]ADE20003.1 hypothetical protein MCRO_0669 [Mycoplasma crocodyli MP145]